MCGRACACGRWKKRGGAVYESSKMIRCVCAYHAHVYGRTGVCVGKRHVGQALPLGVSGPAEAGRPPKCNGNKVY
eukprot:102317-Chlamydomonas_euryale.AAC.1